MNEPVSPLRRDAPVYLFILGYAVLVWTVAWHVGAPAKFQPFSYTGAWFLLTLKSLPLLLVVVALASLRTSEPLAALRERLAHVGRPEVLNGVALALALSVFSGLFTSAKSLMTDVTPFFADEVLATIDAAVPGSGLWQVAWRFPALLRWLEVAYFPAWATLFLLSLAGAVFWPRLRDVRAQYLWTYMLVWIVLGNLVAASVMSAGPTYFEEVTGQATYRQLSALIQANLPVTTGVREWLWLNYRDGGTAPAIGISAFPSLHLAQSTLFVLLAQRIGRLAVWAMLGFGILIFLGSVAFGWHYAIDGWFSIGATVVIWKLVGRALAWGGRQRRALPVSFAEPVVLSATAGSPAS